MTLIHVKRYFYQSNLSRYIVRFIFHLYEYPVHVHRILDVMQVNQGILNFYELYDYDILTQKLFPIVWYFEVFFLRLSLWRYFQYFHLHKLQHALFGKTSYEHIFSLIFAF